MTGIWVRNMCALGILSCGTFVIAAEPTAPVVGISTVIDGDTIDIHGARFRIEGIDAPESDQYCLRDGSQWPCGRQSAAALQALVEGSTVTCAVLGLDKYRRNLGRCSVGGVDIADWMVRKGWAVAYRKYSLDLVPAEEEAHLNKRNMWSGDFEAPWDFRARKRGKPVK